MKLPTGADIESLFRRLYGDHKSHGWRVRMHQRFGYYSGQSFYETVVERLVTEGCQWIDVGGGKTIFPQNSKLSEELASRCKLLVGVDPSENITKNPLVHEAFQLKIEDYSSNTQYDLATLRMVAEHIPFPEPAIESLAKLVKPGGYVVIYTPNCWTPVSIAATLIPNSFHSFFTHLLWNTKEEDVFPTSYQMNTRNRLRELFSQQNFNEVAFRYLDNCTTFQRFRIACFGELCLWRFFRFFRINYPENELLGVYQRV